MIKNEPKLKEKIQEGITNLVNLGVIPADEAQLNLDVIYNSVLNEVCSIYNMDSPRQIVSTFDITYGSKDKSISNKKDVVNSVLMNSLGVIPVNDNGYSTKDVRCTIILNNDNKYLAQYQNIIPNTISINSNISDDGQGNLIQNNLVIGTVDYTIGLFKFNTDIDENSILSYKFDIYDLETNRNKVVYKKRFVEIFADMYQLDLDSALCLDEFKGLNIKENLKNIFPQVLTQQIDQYVLNKYFNTASINKYISTWDANCEWTGNTRVPVTFLYEDLGTFISVKSADFASRHGVVPNVILCSPAGYGILSVNKKFIPIYNDKEETITFTMPSVVGYYNNAKVIITNIPSDYDVDIVLTYKGSSEAQSAGVYAPYIPVTLRNVVGAESNGFIQTTTAYSLAGFAMINPDLVEGIKIINKSSNI